MTCQSRKSWPGARGPIQSKTGKSPSREPDGLLGQEWQVTSKKRWMTH